MDSELWISRLAAAKRHYSLQHQQTPSSAVVVDRLGFEEFEVEEEFRPEFPCPYCYEDHDIVSLRSHIEEEHSLESKVVVCPICSAKVMKDMLSHLTVQHGHLFKLQRQRRLHKFTIPGNQSLSFLGRDIREAHLQVLLGSSGYRSAINNTTNSTADSLLSSLIMNFPTPEAEEISKASMLTAEHSQKERPLSSRKLRNRCTFGVAPLESKFRLYFSAWWTNIIIYSTVNTSLPIKKWSHCATVFFEPNWIKLSLTITLHS